MRPVLVRLGFSVDDLGTAVEPFLRDVQPLLQAQHDWTLDLSGGGERGYFGPTVAVVAAAAVLRARQLGRQASLILPQQPPALAAFCSFSRLVHLARGGAITEAVEDLHAENETSGLHQFHKMNWGGSTPLVRLIRRHLPTLGNDDEDILRTCYSEIAQNIDDHARSPIGGIICARFFSGTGEFRIAVADLGDGIGEVLQRSEPRTGIKVKSDRHALELVIRGGVSSKSRPNNMGQGISNLALVAQGNGGVLRIFSRQAAALVSADRQVVRELPQCAFPGTLVSLSLKVAPAPSTQPSE